MKLLVRVFVALVLGAGATPALAQDAQTYLYDANGRLVGTTTARTTGSSAISAYWLDDADNRFVRDAGATTPPTGNEMAWSNLLLPTQKLTSANGLYTLTLDQSGDLVLRNSGGTAVWNSCTGQGRSLYAWVNAQGQLSIHDERHGTIWSAGGTGNAGAELTLENSGVAVLRTSGGATLWSSTTPCA